MQQILSNVSKVIVDQKGSQNLLYLPLDRLMQLSSQQAPVTAAQGADVPLPRAVSPEPAAAAAPADPRARESLRTRDRETR
jgi:membrane protease subunit HflK